MTQPFPHPDPGVDFAVPSRPPVKTLACYGLAIVSAFLMRLAFPRPGVWPLAWVALIPILMALRAREGRRLFVIAWVFGAAFSYLNVGWLNTLVRFNPFIPAGIVLLGAAMGVWVALSAHGWAALRNRYGFWLGGVLASSWWAGSEWLRTLGPYGFPWGLFGVSQQPAVPLIQLTAFTGVYGLTFLLVLCNGFLADAMMAWLTERWGGGPPLLRDAH